MVSKVKRSPIRSIKDHRGNRRSWRRKSPIRRAVAASSALLASIHRRISKLLSKLTPTNRRKNNNNNNNNNSHHHRNPYKILKKTTKTTPTVPPTHFNFEEFDDYDDYSFSSVCRTLSFDEIGSTKHRLPPQSDGEKRRTVFLDLDETLVHSKAAPPEHFDFAVRPVIDGEAVDFYVLKRPGVDELLEALAARFEVVVFTAALREYAELVLDRLDRENRLVSHRLYRDSCRNVDGKLVKDLSETGRDLGRVVIVDDNPNSFANQPENAILIKPFVDDPWDRELWKLRRFFEGCESFDDMRDAVKQYLVEQSH